MFTDLKNTVRMPILPKADSMQPPLNHQYILYRTR
jgi:hypothetical protein